MLSSLPTSSFSIRHQEELYTWVLHMRKRFPNWIDSRLVKGFHTLLGMGASMTFLEERSLSHLKRLLMTQFLLQKKIETSCNQQKGHLFVRIFSIDSILCVAVIYPKQQNALTDQTILEAANQKVPTLTKISRSSYQWENRLLPYTFCYVELEKMRGKRLDISKVKELENYLKTELWHYLMPPSVFWPYNHEEAFKQLLVLAREISSEKDYPQVSIHFQKQTPDSLEFIIYLARPKAKPSKAIIESYFPSSTQWISHIKQEIEAHIPTLIEAFSIRIPIENYKKRSEVNLLHAREFIGKLLESVIGIFRDYNGGLFKTQKKRFQELSKLFSEKIPNFSLFAEDLFYALMPIEAQISLNDFLFEKLFEGFSQTLNRKDSFPNKPSPYLAVFKSQNFDEITPYLNQAKDLHEQGEMTAFANIKLHSTHYLCLITKRENVLETFGINRIKKSSSSLEQRVLRLAFEAGKVPSFCPYYLSRETRGRTLASFLFEGLTRIGPQDQLECTGYKKIHLNKSKTRYLFELRTHQWSNGQKVTAFQYEQSWKENLIKESDLNLLYVIKNAEAIKKGTKHLESLGVKALQDNLLQVDLERPDSHFLTKLKNPIFFPFLSLSKPISFNGPYLVTKKDNQLLILEKNPYYWDVGHLFFNKIIILFEKCSKKTQELFQMNQIDWFGDPCNFDIKLSKNLKKRVVPYPLMIHFNTRLLPLSSVSIRRALSCVIDRDFIVKNIFSGYKKLTSPLPDEVSSCTSPCINHNIYKAKQLFNQGMKELGLTLETFPPLNLSSYDVESHCKLVKYLQGLWQTIFDIRIDIDIQSWNHFYQKFDQGNFEIGGFFKCLLSLDPLPFLESFAHLESNFSYWEHPDYTEIIHTIKQTTSLKTRKEKLEEAENFLVRHMPVIPLVSLVYSYAHHPKLKDYVIDSSGSIDFRYAYYS